MKKRSTGTSGTEGTATRSDRTKRSTSGRVVEVSAVGRTWTVGMDLGDRTSHLCVLDEAGIVVERGKVQTTRESFRKRFEGQTRMRIAIEVGTHSPWVSRLLKELGHEVLVANPRKTRLIYQNRGKQDRVDAEALARIARLDSKLLYPVAHRPESVAQDLAVLRARDALVRTRTLLVNHVRGAVKATGHRVKKCSARTFADQAVDQIPPEVREALSSVLTTIKVVSKQILVLDKRIGELGKKKYPETALLRQVGGVGPIVALAYVLTLEHPGRFQKSRAVGPYLGLVPREARAGTPTRNCASRKRETPSCAGFWSSRRSTSSGHSEKTATSDVSARRCRPAGNATRRNEPSSPSHESWRCCCIGSGGPQRSTNRSARPKHRKTPPRRPDKPAKKKASSERLRSTVAIPIRVNAPSGRLRSGLRSPRTSARGGKPVARLQRPFGLNPLMHRTDMTRPTRVRMEARRPTRAQGFPAEINTLS